VGSLWSVGYLAAPALFSLLDDRALAGRVAGALFGLQLYVALACAPLIVACELLQGRRGRTLALPLAMLALIAAIDLVVRPLMAGSRPPSRGFVLLHGTAAGLYLAASLLGLLLVLARPRAQAGGAAQAPASPPVS
jgi:hypothetical protein